MAAAIFVLLGLGFAMTRGGRDAATTFDLFQWHKSVGFVALGLTLAHLAARLCSRAPPPLAAPRWELRLAATTQASMFALALVAAATGWLVVSTASLPVPTSFFGLFVIPNIARPGPALFRAATIAHDVAVWLLAACVTLHVAGAFKHALFDRDDALARILPRTPRRASQSTGTRQRSR